MSRFNGMAGGVTFANGYDVNVKRFNITDEIDLGKAIDWDTGDGYEEVLSGGPKRWAGGITCNMDSATAMIAPGTSGTATLQCTTGKTWSGTIVVERIENEVELSPDVVEVTFSFLGSGAPTRPS